ncbi:hypothetical protein J4Q44_G00385840, partial [Coregonus suidteri]
EPEQRSEKSFDQHRAEEGGTDGRGGRQKKVYQEGFLGGLLTRKNVVVLTRTNGITVGKRMFWGHS